MYSIDSCKLGFGGDKTPTVVMKALVGIGDKPNITGRSNTLHFGDDVYKDICKYMTFFYVRNLFIVIIF